MSPKRIFLFSGMGGDERLFGPIRLPGIDLVTPRHLAPHPDEDLQQYAGRVADFHEIGPEDVIGGASFGGMLGAEIASRRKIAGLVLLGSCLQPGRLPWSHRFIERVGGLIPDAVLSLRSWKPLVRWRFEPLTSEAEVSLIAMAADCPIDQIRAFGRMAIRWPGAPRPTCPMLIIHGAHDRIIPLRCADPDIILADAGHAFTLTHSAQTIVAIQDFLRRD